MFDVFPMFASTQEIAGPSFPAPEEDVASIFSAELDFDALATDYVSQLSRQDFCCFC